LDFLQQKFADNINDAILLMLRTPHWNKDAAHFEDGLACLVPQAFQQMV
jgi:hypothetical protein